MGRDCQNPNPPKLRLKYIGLCLLIELIKTTSTPNLALTQLIVFVGFKLQNSTLIKVINFVA